MSKLETNNKNRKAIFIKFNVIKRQFYVDYQKTIDMLVKLDKTKQNKMKTNIGNLLGVTWICLKNKKILFIKN